jgi:hypothetical protein
LLERNAQQQAAARQAALVKAQAKQAAATGAEQQRQRRIASGLDPATGRPLPSAGATSRLARIDQEPAAFRGGGSFFEFRPTTGPTVVDGIRIWPQTPRKLVTPISFAELLSEQASIYAESAQVLDLSQLEPIGPNQLEVAVSSRISADLERATTSSRQVKRLTVTVDLRVSEQVPTAALGDAIFEAQAFVGPLQLKAFSRSDGGVFTSNLSTSLLALPFGSVTNTAPDVTVFNTLRATLTSTEIQYTLGAQLYTIPVPPESVEVMQEILNETEWPVLCRLFGSRLRDALVDGDGNPVPLPPKPLIAPALKNFRIEWQL